jgi:hypothetical protein
MSPTLHSAVAPALSVNSPHRWTGEVLPHPTAAHTDDHVTDAARRSPIPMKTDPDNSWGYSPETDTVRVGRHDLARLLLEFHELLRKQEPGS